MKKLIRAVLIFVLVFVVGILAAFYRSDIPVENLRADYADAASRFVEVDGMSVHYKDEGEGPAVVLLHGFGSSLHTWDGWVSELASSFRLVRLDLPGFGLTGPNAEGDYRATTSAAFLDRFADRVGLETFSLAGNSMGGQISWVYTLRHPERVEKLILVNAAGAPRGNGPPPERGGSAVMRFIRLPVIDRLVPRITPRFLFARSLREVYVDDTLVTDELIDRHYHLTLRTGNRDAMSARLGTRDEDLRDQIATITTPTLVMWGEADLWIPVSHAERFHAALPNSRLAVYPGVGHVLMEESPVDSAAGAREFLLTHAPR